MTASNPGGLSTSATGAGSSPASSPQPASGSLEPTIARVLTTGTYISIGLLAVGVALMLASGIGPLSGGPAFDPGTVLADLAALRPAAFLWLGLIVVIATPSVRVAASGLGYARRGERAMTIVAGLILLVIALSVAVARGLEG
jgi:uncharacterized membrane protein